MISTEYELTEGRGKLLLWNDDERPEKRMKSVEHNKTKGHVNMMGVQLVDAVEEFDQKVRELLQNRVMASRLLDWSTSLAGGTRTRGTWLLRWKPKRRSQRETHGSS